MINPQLMISGKYNLSKFDFEPMEFHLRLYQAALSLSKHGAKSIDAISIYNLTENKPTVKQLFDQNNLIDFVDTIKQLTNIDNIDLYYQEVRKNSILRKYRGVGFDISRFEGNVESYTIKDIVDYFDGLQISVKKDFFVDKNIIEAKTGDGFERVKEEFKAEPMYGATTFSKYLNEAARGWLRGQLSLYSIGSGLGKSTIGLYNLVLVCCPYIWDDEQNQYIKNPCYQHSAGLYIQFEMDIDREITPKIVASISGVPTYHILNGQYEEGEEARVDRAIEILHESEIYTVTMPSFTTSTIETYIRDYVINKQVGYVVYDYITEGPSISSDIASQNKVQTRSDQVLAGLASKLKDLAVEYNVAILTFSQVNANAYNQEILDASCSAGSRAMQNKCDVAGIIMPPKKQELEICDMMMEKYCPNSKLSVNRVLSLYKVRFGSYEQGIKIWGHLDLNTGHFVDCFVTTKYNQPYDMSKTNLIYRE